MQISKITPLFSTLLLAGIIFFFPATQSSHAEETHPYDHYELGYDTPVDPALQARLEAIDTKLRAKYNIAPEQDSVGILDLRYLRLAMIRPDRGDYAASVAKIGILLAYFQLHPEAATNLDPAVRHELGEMAKASSNEMAAKYSRQMGLREIQAVINSYHFYDTNHGGGLWMGRHYGGGGERIGDPLGDNSHAATVRQLLRYFLMLEQGKLVSPEASRTMREIFASPDIPFDKIKFVEGLAGRNVQIIRKWGTWRDWFHDSAVITGPGRHYILAAMTHHPRGDDYLVDLAREVDDLMSESVPGDKPGAGLGDLKADRILFLGNSITRHGPMPSIGWTNDWGMAASAPEKDYVHLLSNSIAELTGKTPQIRIAGGGSFEKNFETYDFTTLNPELEFKPDLVIVALGENVPALTNSEMRAQFKTQFVKLLSNLKGGGATVFVRSCFWPEKTRDGIIRQACAEAGTVFVDIGGISKDESNFARAERKIDHAGVAAHPGDKGMRALSDALLKAIQDYANR